MNRLNPTLAAFGALVFLGACSSGGSSSGGGTSPTPTPTPGSSAACPADFCAENGSVRTLSGTIDQDFALDASFEYRLDGVVTVGNGNQMVSSAADVQAIRDAGVDLTIPAGTNIKAFNDGILLVTRGSRLLANGSASQPITFSSLDADFDGLGEWGGVVIQGFAPQFGAGGTGACFGSGTVCNVEGEGGGPIAFYGGNDPADDSGVIRYVRIAEGGLVAGPDNEVNGLTLQGVGHQTEIEFVQVHGNLDDGVEWFGGTVNARYLVLTNNDDDSIDYDEGYQGNIQYAIVRMDPSKTTPTGTNDPRGIEANSSDDEFVPETNAVLANLLVIGAEINDGEPGMRLRGALTTAVFNAAVTNFSTGCVRIDDADTNGDGTKNELSDVTLVNVIGDCAGGFYTHEVADSETNAGAQTFTVNEAFAINESLASLASAPVINAVNNGSGFVFDQTDYIGAVEPGTPAATAWWAGWTLPGTLGGDIEEAPADADFVSCNVGQTVCTISGTVDEDYTMVSSVEWRLDGVVTVGNGNQMVSNAADVTAVRNAGVDLTIRPGTVIKAFNDGILLVTRGSRLLANGTEAAPITFSSLDADFDGLGEWGGVVIQGFAPQFGAGGTGACFGSGTVCNVEGEGGGPIAFYGGNDPADDSGVIRYVRIAEGGLVAGPDNEVNGLTLQGVGHQTEIEFVQVHGNLDDGVEWFGGTVNARYLVLTNNDDDSIDYDEGYQGNIQYAIVRMDPSKTTPTGTNDPRGIEANSSDDEFVPETNATLANVLIIGAALNDGEPGMRLRGALTTAVFNTAVTSFSTGCVRIDDADTNGDGTKNELSDVTLVNVIGDCAGGFYTHEVADSETNAGALAFAVDAAFALNPAAGNLASAPAITPVNNGSGFAFDATDYIGAVEPGTSAANAWWANWTLPGTLN